ncbi:hypothetical protein JTB14_027275 [Gonioctena quinquepunctata]|nr:hypothetical protein JTB14_027275 [Gonioctena quinquepunctata]
MESVTQIHISMGPMLGEIAKKLNKLHVNGGSYTLEQLENPEETEYPTLGKPQRAPSTPSTIKISKEITKSNTTPPEPSAKNPQGEINTPARPQFPGKPREVGDRQKMRTCLNSGK